MDYPAGGTHARFEDLDGAGFGQIIIRPDVQPLD
jgi:hypothetical protein